MSETRNSGEGRPARSGYVSQSLDTPEDVDRRMFEHWRAIDPLEKVEIAMNWTLAVRDVARAGIRAQYPSASEAEVDLRLLVRCYGEEYVARHLPGRLQELERALVESGYEVDDVDASR